MKYALVILCSCLFACKGPTVDSDTDVPVREFPVLEANRYNVGLLVINGTFNSELTAPMDIFHHTKFREGVKAMNVFTVSNTYDLVTTFEGLTIKPDFNFLDTVPQIDILVIPAAEHNLYSDLEDEVLIDFVRRTAEQAEWVTSHCDGAFVLAKTGLLDDKVSTTFPGDIDDYKKMYPHLDVRDSVLFVHDGKFITSAGGAKSFEASLYLCELLYGKENARELAEGMVIDWELEQLKYLRIER